MMIYFVYPVCPGPVGGLKQIRLIVSLLCDLGADARLLIDYRELPNSADDSHNYGLTTPTATFDISRAAQRLDPDDVVVFPEHHLDRYLDSAKSWKCRKAVFNQNGFGALATRPCPHEARRQLDFVLAGAPYTAALSHHFYRVPWDRVFLVKLYVQRAPFAEGDPASRQLAVCYMPRKMAAHTDAVRRAVEASEPGVPWVEIDGVSESTVARRLQSSAVFLSTQNREGFGLPALEAMATGTLVAGYAGTFPFRHPYATRANGVWAADRRGGAAAAVLKAIRVARSGGPEYREMLAQGHRTAAGYS